MFYKTFIQKKESKKHKEVQDVYACLFRKMLIIKFNVMITDKVFNFINKIECAWVILNK